MKLGYICTNYNNSHFTADAVRSLAASAGNDHELRVIVVDNQSKPEHLAALKKIKEEFPCVDLLLNDENVGYFPGLNCGIHHMRQRYPDITHIVIGNNDLLFPADFCSMVEGQIPLLDKYPVISPDIVTLDGVHQNPHVIKSISKSREIVYDIYYANYIFAKLILWAAKVTKPLTERADSDNHQIAQCIHQGHGSCYLIGPKFFKHYVAFWAPTFLMGEEYFLSKQLSDDGLQLFYTPDIKLTHCYHGSVSSVPSRKLWEIARESHKVYRKYVKVIG